MTTFGVLVIVRAVSWLDNNYQKLFEYFNEVVPKRHLFSQLYHVKTEILSNNNNISDENYKVHCKADRLPKINLNCTVPESIHTHPEGRSLEILSGGREGSQKPKF